MFFASVVSAIAAVVVCLIMASPFSWGLFAWMTAVCSLGSWSIMIPTKLSEGKVEDQAPHRFIQLLAGAIVGVLAWVIADWLMISQGTWNNMGINPGSEPAEWNLGNQERRSRPIATANLRRLFCLLVCARGLVGTSQNRPVRPV